MADIFDYLHWRGDLTIKQVPLGEVDSLIFCRLAYMNFDGIVPGGFDEKPVFIQDAAQQCIADAEKKDSERDISKEDIKLLTEIALCPRYAKMALTGYVCETDESQEKQFAAVTILTDKRSSYTAFRGTDNTLIGWKEDFNMTFQISVPSQRAAAAYLKTAMESIGGSFYVGGHSKGGNLAVYAAAFSEDACFDRIVTVFNHDGPGFDTSVLETEGYRRAIEKTKTFVPQSSFFGLMLYHEETITVVHSNHIGIFQHDLYSWEIERDRFVYEQNVSENSTEFNEALKEWIAKLEPGTRKLLIDGLYKVVVTTQAKTFSDLFKGKNSLVLLRALKDIDEPTRELLVHAVSLLTQRQKSQSPPALIEE